MTATTVRLLVALGVLATAVGWGFAKVWETLVGRYLPVPWTAAGALALLAAALLIWALMVRPRLRHAPRARPLEPLVAARTAALAMAASRTGAVAGGVYLGIAISFISLWSIDAGRERVLSSGAAVLASLAVVVIALWLERMCRLPEQMNDDDNAVRP